MEGIEKLCPDGVRCLPRQLTFRNLLGEKWENFEFNMYTKWVRKESVVVMKLLQDGTKKWDVGSSNWECACSDVVDWWVSG